MGESLILGLLAGRSATQSHLAQREGEKGNKQYGRMRGGKGGEGGQGGEGVEGGEGGGGGGEVWGEGTKCSLPPVESD